MLLRALLTFAAALVTCVICASTRESKTLFYRKDYTLREDFDAFYKYHKVRQNFSEAVATCSAEGASLFRPLSSDESSAIFSDVVPNDVPRIHIGVHDLYSEGDFITIDGTPIEDTYSNWAPGEPNDNNGQEDCVVLFTDGTFNDGQCHEKEPFVCKRSVVNITQNVICETYDLEYKYNTDMDKCYKAHTKPMRWRDAYKICKSEEAALVVINGDAEARYLVSEMNKLPESRFPGNFDKGNFHVGFNDIINNGVYLTIEGKSLSDAGYERWSPGQPDNQNGVEHCGSVFRDGLLNDINCDSRAMFFCEKSLSNHGNPVALYGLGDSNPPTAAGTMDLGAPRATQASTTTQRELDTGYNLPGAIVALPDA